MRAQEKKRFVSSVVVTLAIVVLLIFSGPAGAVQVRVKADKDYYNSNDVAVFTVSVDIQTNERVPIHNLTLKIYNSSSDVVRECSFSPDGNPLTACANILDVAVINQLAYGYGYGMYGNGFGYGLGGWSIHNQTFYPGGYGYGFGSVANNSGYNGELSYNITWNLSAEDIGNGNYTADLWAYASDNQGHYRIYSDENTNDNVLALDKSKPSSNASSSLYDNTGNISVGYSANDIGSGLQSVALWYRLDNGNWTNTGMSKTASSGSFEFTPGGDGNYSFYTIATDLVGNVEDAPAGGDSTTIYDTTRPSSSASSPSYYNTGNISVNFNASDSSGSGLNHTALWYNRNSSGWVDSGLRMAGTSGTFSFAPIGNGNYSFYTIARDLAGNVETKSTADSTTIYDTVRPSSVANSGPYVNSGNITVSFTASNGFSGVNSTRLYYNKNNTGWTDSGITKTGTGGVFDFAPSGDGNYSFYTIARDFAGNVENAPGVADTATIYDSAAPGSAATSPTYDNDGNITVSYAASDSLSGIRNVTLWYRQSGNWTRTGPTKTSASGSFEFAPSGDGNYKFYTIAFDRAGNAESKSVADDNTTFDTTRPSSRAKSVLYTRNGNITVNYTSSDGLSGVKNISLYYKKNSGNWTSTNSSITSSGSFAFDANGEGNYSFRTLATDNAGNLETKTTADNLTIYDMTRPTSSASSPRYNNSNMSIRYSATDLGSGILTVRLYQNRNSTGWVYSNRSSSLASGTFYLKPNIDGSYQFYTISSDKAGNNETKSAADTTTSYDTQAPNLTVRWVGSTGSTEGDLYAYTDDNSTCSYGIGQNLDGMEETGLLTHKQHLALTSGTYTYTVECTDRATNLASGSVTFKISARGGGGGGFFIFPVEKPQPYKAEQQWEEMLAGDIASMTIDKGNISVSKIVFGVSARTLRPVLGVKMIEILPSNIAQIGHKLFQYIQITAENIQASFVRIRFRVRLSWLTNQNLLAQDIGLYRYTTQWELLKTNLLYQDEKYAYFEAESPGFSYFAIAQIPRAEVVELKPEQKTEPTAAVVAQPPETQPKPPEQKAILPVKAEDFGWLLLTIVVAVVAAAATAAVVRYVRIERSEKQEGVIRSAMRGAHDWILLAHNKGKDNLYIQQALIESGWPRELAKKLVLETAGQEKFDDPLGKMRDVIAEARQHGKTEDEIRDALKRTGWPDWKIQELLA